MKRMDGFFSRWKTFLPLIFILILAAALRLYQLPSVPPAASLDEASIGYNAYSLLQTGRDEYGQKYPLLLRAYDDYRPGLYVYVVMPFVQLLGLTVLAVRLPSVILSIIDVLLTYGIAKTLFASRKEGKFIALVSAFLLAISPWHLYISRLGHEANLGLFFVILGVYFFAQAFFEPKKIYTIVLSSVSFALSLYGYQSQKLVVPVLVLFWGCLFYKKLWAVKKWVIAAVIIGALVVLPAAKASLGPTAMTRYIHTSATALDDPIVQKETAAFVRAKQSGDVIGIIWFNRRVIPLKIIIENYVSHFSLVWLFTGQANEAFKVPFTGLLFPWELLGVLMGIIFLFRQRDKQTSFLLLSLVLSAPVAAAFTTQAPHAMRAFTFVPGLQILEGVGLVTLFSMLSPIMKRYMILLTVFISVISVGYLCFQYFIVFPRLQSQPYQYALHEAIRYVIVHKKDYATIVVSNDKNLTQSYMFYLFDSRYSPSRYLSQGGSKSGGFAQWHVIENIVFRPIDWKNEKPQGSTLYVGNPEEFGIGAKKISDFPYRNGKVGVVAVEKSL